MFVLNLNISKCNLRHTWHVSLCLVIMTSASKHTIPFPTGQNINKNEHCNALLMWALNIMLKFQAQQWQQLLFLKWSTSCQLHTEAVLLLILFLLQSCCSTSAAIIVFYKAMPLLNPRKIILLIRIIVVVFCCLFLQLISSLQKSTIL